MLNIQAFLHPNAAGRDGHATMHAAELPSAAAGRLTSQEIIELLSPSFARASADPSEQQKAL